MKYLSARDFRRALESRLGHIYQETGMPHSRLRKIVAFDRFLARLIQHQPDSWVLKGGFALQLRIGDRARTTKDIDLLAMEKELEIFPAFQTAGVLDIGDWFTFETTRSSEPIQEGIGVTRYKTQSRLDGRIFDDFHIDVSIGDPVVGAVELIATPDLLAFANLEPTRVPCYPITQQIAEKLHAYTRPRGSGASSRVKDFVDILLLAELGEIKISELRLAIRATFDNAETHNVPDKLPSPPSGWVQTYKRMVGTLDLDEISFAEAYAMLQQFLDPVLGSRIEVARWNPSKWGWE